jgi:hypothetical protein
MDIDIDIAPEVDVEELFPNVIRSSRIENDELKKHNVGYHFQNIAVDPITGFAAIPAKPDKPVDQLKEHGYIKIDMITVNLLKHFKSKEEMRELQEKEPDWSLLEDEEVVSKLFHLAKHFDVISRVKPRSIVALADVFALIRPNKLKMLDKYLSNPEQYREELFTKRDPSDMRRAHALPYALLIVLQLHLIKEGRI